MTNEQLGVDIKLNIDNDIQFNYQDDFVLVDDVNNLIQAITTRIQTGLTELELHLLYGSRIPVVIGSGATTNLLTLIEQATREALYQEPRIQSIITISAVFKTDQEVTIGIEVLPINQEEPLNIIFPFFLTT